jgi:hypothetical protein
MPPPMHGTFTLHLQCEINLYLQLSVTKEYYKYSFAKYILVKNVIRNTRLRARQILYTSGL